MEKLKARNQLGGTGIQIPPVVFGTSCLGNLYRPLDNELKLEIIKGWFEWVESPVVIDTAGKYGAGLALEVIGNGLRQLDVKPEDVVISNKLGWLRTPMKAAEPTFEPGVWADLKFDAIQKISYHGIKECWEQGNELLGGGYKTDLLSVHDPDEYIARAKSDKERAEKMMDIVEAYLALSELKKKGEANAIGVGAKDWHIIREINKHIRLDWAMLAVSLTVMRHPPDLLEFVEELSDKRIGIINSAVFHSGFLTGSEFFDYQRANRNNPEDKARFTWRDKFFYICDKYDVNPAAACVQFGMSPKGVASIALNTSRPERIQQNVELVQAQVPNEFWKAMKGEGLIRQDYPFLG